MTADNTRAVAYVRVSMARDGGISPELQMAAITQHCRRCGYQLATVLEDLDLSGRVWRGRQFEEALWMLEHDEADVIVVWRWSRVSRNRLDWAVAVDRVEAAGGRLDSATEPFDVGTPTGRFARGMLAEFAAYESDRMGDLWREVRERRARLGLPVTGRAQLGYLKVGGAYVPDRRTGPVVRNLYRRFNEGSRSGH
jgi:site-specific DNA recombinase